MIRVLFVDDEPNVLQGMRRLFRNLEDRWEMEFAPGGAEALAAIRQRPFDVVVSDMRMPGMDGAELLGEVKRIAPGSIRIVLSGQSEKSAILKCIGVAHQYLAKPCDPETLRRSVARAGALKDLLDDEALKSAITRMDNLPTLPDAFHRLVGKLQEEHVSLHDLGDVIAADIGMSLRILQIVNSAYVGLRRPIADVHHAVSYLGLETITSLVLTINAFSHCEGRTPPEFSTEELWRHTLLAAEITRRLAGEELEPRAADDAALAAMLHDVGQLILAMNLPQRYAEVVRRRQAGEERHAVETRILGVSHAEVGAYVVGLWGLPDSVVEAIAYHADPARCPRPEFGPLAIVHVASGLAHEALEGRPGGHIDQTWLDRLGVLDRLPRWRELARASQSAGVSP